MRFKPRISLRTALIGVGVFSVGLAITEACILAPARYQQSVVKDIHAIGGSVTYDFEVFNPDVAPNWRHRASETVGKDLIGNVDTVSIRGHQIEASRVAPVLERMDKLKSINWIRLSTQLDDRCVLALANIDSLPSLSIGGIGKPIPDLAPLTRLTKLEELSMNSRTGITAERLGAIAAFPAIQQLDLSFSDVDDGSVVALLPCRTLRELWISYSNVTSHGVQRLLESPYLKTLIVDDLQMQGLDPSVNPSVTIEVH